MKQEVKELDTSLPQTVRVATGKLQHILHILRRIQTNPVSALPPFHTTESQARAIRHVHIKLSKDLLHIVIVCINTDDENLFLTQIFHNVEQARSSVQSNVTKVTSQYSKH